MTKDDDESGNFNNDDLGEGGKGSPRPGKKILAEVDLSDGRDEKEKAKQMLDKEEQERQEERKMMEDWKRRQDEKAKESSGKGTLLDKMNNYQSMLKDSPRAIEESGNSSSISGTKKPDVEESYSADSFDESLSGSNSKKSNIWTEKLKMVSDEVKKGAIEDSLKSLTSSMAASGSKDKSIKSSAIEESSERYEDDEFESISKSKGEMAFIPTKQEPKKLTTLKD